MVMDEFQVTDYDYEFLTDTWEGSKGAAYNVVYEDLLGAGMITRDGKPTSRGYSAIQKYEMHKWNI
jgi:hypothetical protein